jgi:CRP/FNR family cyclic AMP-dependent transcriptional regulator
LTIGPVVGRGESFAGRPFPDVNHKDTIVTPIEIFRKIPVFSCLDDHELDALVRVAIKKTFPKNTILINEGDQTDSLYVIYSGKVKAAIIDEQGKEVILSIFGPGEYFGEMAFIDGEVRSASIVTRQPTQVMIIHRDDFRHTLSSNPDIAFNLLKGVVRRLREATKQIESLALMDVYGRVARLLVHFAKPVDGTLTITEKLTHQEIANMTGSSREMVSRVLKELMVGDYISVEKKTITLNKELPYSW